VTSSGRTTPGRRPELRSDEQMVVLIMDVTKAAEEMKRSQESLRADLNDSEADIRARFRDLHKKMEAIPVRLDRLLEGQTQKVEGLAVVRAKLASVLFLEAARGYLEELRLPFEKQADTWSAATVGPPMALFALSAFMALQFAVERSWLSLVQGMGLASLTAVVWLLVPRNLVKLWRRCRSGELGHHHIVPWLVFPMAAHAALFWLVP